MNARRDRFYVTTPIYYVNDVPHIGHAYTTILADVLSRYHRLLGVPTHFLTGSDEHGQKVYDAAAAAGISPQEQTDRTVVRFQDLWKRIDISHDDFLRTTEPRHTAVVQEILQDLFDRDEIYAGDYEGWYSVSEERFYTEKELVDGKSPEGKPVEKIVEKNYFFRMSKYQEWLIDHIEKHPEFIQPATRRNETLGYLKKPLGDLCISRPKQRLPWGVELPFDDGYVCYVWFDALVNYISAVGYRRDDAQFEKWWPADYHLVGKDILTTHTVYWPTMLRAMGLAMPKTVFAHGWWLVSGAKISKSDGNAVDPMDIIDLYGVDALRYYLMAEMTLGQDSTFTIDEDGQPISFIKRYNSDLANDLGNMVSRVVTMIQRNFDSVVPAPGELTDDDRELERAALAAVDGMVEHLGEMTLDRGLSSVLEAVRAGNRYFDRTKPWGLVKSGDTERLGTVLYTAAECLRIVSGLLFPVMPTKMAELRTALGLGDAAANPSFEQLGQLGTLTAGSKLPTSQALFPRIELKKAKKTKEPKKAKPKAPAKPVELAPGVIDVHQFFETKLRVAKVVEAVPVPKADRLLQLQVDLGDERRQIVAGIAEHYSAEEMVGKLVVVVSNLMPAKIRGLESNGMLLAAKADGVVKVVTVDGEVPPGSEVG